MAHRLFRFAVPVLHHGRSALNLSLVMLALHAGGPNCVAHADEKNAPQNVPPSAPPPVGQVIKVTLPIQNSVADQVILRAIRAVGRLSAAGGQKILIFEFTTGQSEFGRGSSFYKASELAAFIAGSELDGVKTYAYLPGTVKGHAVLPIIACHEIVMHPDAQIGEAGIDEKGAVAAHLRSTYSRIADERKTVVKEIALGMLDGRLEVLKVQTPTSVEFVFREDLAALRKDILIKDDDVSTLIPEGEMGLFSGQDARDLGFVKLLTEDLRKLAQSLDLPQEAIEASPWLDGETRAVRVKLHEPITEKSARAVQRMIEKQITRKKVTFVCLDIYSPGGSIDECLGLAVYLSNLDPARVRTVAYVAEEAGGAAALIALACDHLVMRRGAQLGGLEVDSEDDAQRERLGDRTETIQAVAKAKHRSWSLPAALIDPELQVYRYRLRGKNRLEYFCDDELKLQDDSDAWQIEEQLTQPGKTLDLIGVEAKKLGLAHHLVDNFDQLRQLYGIEDELEVVEPGWVDFLVDALARSEVAWMLLVIGGMALYAELQTPGVGIGGFVATVCFALFFWSKYLYGTAEVFEILLFVLGVGFLLLEIFVIPGFGICGLGGGALVIVSLVLASQRFVIPSSTEQITELRKSMMVVGGAGLGIFVLASLLRRYLPHAPVFNRVMLHPPEGEEKERIAQSESLVDYEHLLGQTGTTSTQLTPGGKARFGKQLVDVIADGELIEPQTPIVVVEVHGNRVVVAAAEARG